MILRKVAYLFCLAALLSLTACQPVSKKGNVFLIVDFDPQVPVKYKMVSERDSSVTLDANSDKGKSEKIYEKLEVVISYKPVGQPDVYGLTTVEATCHSAKVTRKKGGKTVSAKDAVESLTGRTYIFTVSPTGKIADYTSLNKLASELGSKAFADSGKQGRMKAPDMVADFVCLQWHLWDSASTAGQTVAGLKPGTSWTTRQFVPLPVPVGFTRDTTFTLGVPEPFAGAEGVEPDNTVVIDSTYSVGEQGLENWPKIYTGSFDMKGTLGFLSNFKLVSIDGTGKQTFNVDKGLLEKDVLQYKVKLSAGLRWPLPGVSPEVTVDQKMSVELLDN